MLYETESKSKTSINSTSLYGHVVQRDKFVVFTASQFPNVILCLYLTTLETSKGMVPHTHS